MKKKLLMTMIGLVLTLSMALGVLYGCTPQGVVSPTAPTTTKPGATTPGKTTTAPPPVKTGEVFKFKLQSGTAAGHAMWPYYEEFCADVKTASGGRVELEILPAGAIVAVAEIFDAVSSGAIEGGLAGACSYWTKVPEFAFTCNITGGLEYNEYMCWLFSEQFNGEQLARDVWAKHDLYYIPFQPAPPEAEWLSNKPITKAADMKGLKFRGLGWANNVMKEPEFGCSATFIPGPELYSALQTGVLDFCEYDQPHYNWSYGLHEVAKYQSFPGIHQLARDSGVVFNMKTWNKFPDDIKHIIRMCAARNTVRSGAFSWAEAALAMEKQIEYGVTMVYQPPELQKLYRDVSFRLAEKHVENYPDSKHLWESQKELMRVVRPYMNMQKADYGE